MTEHPSPDSRVERAVRLFADGRASLGRAAETAGLPRRAFHDELGRRGVRVIDYPATDLDAELALDLGPTDG